MLSGLRPWKSLGLTEVGEPDPAEGTQDGQDAFAADDEDRIAGLDMHFEPDYPSKLTKRAWARDAKDDPIPPGLE